MPKPTLEDLESAVLQLPKAERVRLAERLLASLEEEDGATREGLGLAETRAALSFLRDLPRQ